jgi:hypothetical protein
VEVQLHVFLTSTLDEGEFPDSRLDSFTPEEIAPSTHWMERCVGPISDLDAVI